MDGEEAESCSLEGRLPGMTVIKTSFRISISLLGISFCDLSRAGDGLLMNDNLLFDPSLELLALQSPNQDFGFLLL